MNDLPSASAFTQAAQPTENLAIVVDILAWFNARGGGWQQEIEGVLDFYIDSVEHPASDPDAFEPGEMDPVPGPSCRRPPTRGVNCRWAAGYK